MKKLFQSRREGQSRKERHFPKSSKDVHTQQLADWGDRGSPKPFYMYRLPWVLLMEWENPAVSHGVWRQQQEPEGV